MATDTLNLPTWQQMANAAIFHAQTNLKNLMKDRCIDKDWTDADVDVDETTELVLINLNHLATAFPEKQEEFVEVWYRLTSAIRLAKGVFSRPDSYYGRSLKAMLHMMESIPEMLEYTLLEKSPQ